MPIQSITVRSSECVKGVLRLQWSPTKFPDALNQSIALAISSNSWRRIHEIHHANDPVNVSEEAIEIME
jgi:hypothetical protein